MTLTNPSPGEDCTNDDRTYPVHLRRFHQKSGGHAHRIASTALSVSMSNSGAHWQCQRVTIASVTRIADTFSIEYDASSGQCHHPVSGPAPCGSVSARS
jgi:hypothetical protein